MKTLSLKEPWASLVVLGEKQKETRGWKSSYRGVILIHASQKISREHLEQYPFNTVLTRHFGYWDIYSRLLASTGCIIGAAYLSGFESTSAVVGLSRQEFAFGDYSDGRYAWHLRNAVQFDRPVTARGKLSLWDFDPEKLHADDRAKVERLKMLADASPLA